MVCLLCRKKGHGGCLSSHGKTEWHRVGYTVSPRDVRIGELLAEGTTVFWLFCDVVAQPGHDRFVILLVLAIFFQVVCRFNLMLNSKVRA